MFQLFLFFTLGGILYSRKEKKKERKKEKKKKKNGAAKGATTATIIILPIFYQVDFQNIYMYVLSHNKSHIRPYKFKNLEGKEGRKEGNQVFSTLRPLV